MPKFAKPWFRSSRGVWYITLKGVQHNLGPCTEEEAWDKSNELKKQLKADCKVQPVTSDCLPVIIDSFLDWIKRRSAAETFEWYRHRLQRLARLYPDLPASDLTIDMVEDWVDKYDLSVTSRRNYFRSIKRCMKWARRRQMIRRNRIRDLEVPAGESREIVVTPEEFELLDSMIPDPGFRDLVLTTWETGCRPQESLRVEVRHVDFDRQRWVFPKSESKNKKISRVVYQADKSMEITRRLIAAHPEGKLFRNSVGKAWTPFAVSCAFSRIQIRIGKRLMKEQKLEVKDEEITQMVKTLKPTRTIKGKIAYKTPAQLRQEAKRKLTFKLACTLAPRWSLYALRHSWATHALLKGVDPLTTAILMGHSDPSQFSKTYQHLSLSPVHMLDQARKAAK